MSGPNPPKGSTDTSGTDTASADLLQSMYMAQLGSGSREGSGANESGFAPGYFSDLAPGGVPSGMPLCPIPTPSSDYYQRLLASYDVLSSASPPNSDLQLSSSGLPWSAGVGPLAGFGQAPIPSSSSSSSSPSPYVPLPSMTTAPVSSLGLSPSDIYNQLFYQDPQQHNLGLGPLASTVSPQYAAMYQQQLLAAVAAAPMAGGLVGLPPAAASAAAYSYLLPPTMPFGAPSGRPGMPSQLLSCLGSTAASPSQLPGGLAAYYGGVVPSHDGGKNVGRTVSSNAVYLHTPSHYTSQTPPVDVALLPVSSDLAAETAETLAKREKTNLNSNTVPFDDKLYLRGPAGDAGDDQSETVSVSTTTQQNEASSKGRETAPAGLRVGTHMNDAATGYVPLALTASDDDPFHAKEDFLRGSEVVRSQSLYAGEQEEWTSPVSLEDFANELDGVLGQLKNGGATAVSGDSAGVRLLNLRPRIPSRFQALVCAGSLEASPTHCAVCWEGVRPRDLALLGDLLVVCKDCGVTVHRRCYGVQRTLAGCNTVGGQRWFICDLCRYSRGAKKGHEPVTCIICCRGVRGQAFKKVEGALNTWVHIYCALLTKDRVVVRNFKTMSGVMLLPGVKCPPCVKLSSADDGVPVAVKEVKCEKLEVDEPLSARNVENETAVDDTNGDVPMENRSDQQPTPEQPQKNEREFLCMFCRNAEGYLVQCAEATCSQQMHLYCLREKMYQREQEEKNHMSTALTISMFPYDSAEDGDKGVGSRISAFCPDHMPLPRYCVCRKPFVVASDMSVMVGCDVCGDWLHGSCIGSQEVTYALQSEYYECARCQKQRLQVMFLDQLWAMLPLTNDDVQRCWQVLGALYTRACEAGLVQAVDEQKRTASLFNLSTVIPNHITPVPFTDMILFVSAWQTK